jgi:nucleotide-binding universal stress UspA family protein
MATRARSRRIVVGVDGSAEARVALRWAEHLARLDGARIEAVLVRHPRLSIADPRAITGRLLSDTVEQTFGASRPRGLTLRTVDGKPAEELLARSAGASLLVVGSRGRSGVVARLLGSVSASCVERASCPVLVAHRAAPQRADGGYARVVVGIDGSASSRCALRWAGQYARRAGAHLEVVLAWTDADVLSARFGPVPAGSTAQQGMDRWAGEIVDDVFAGRRPADLRVTAEAGSASDILLRRAHHARLLVVGTRGYSGIENLALGSVSARCVAQARCAVVVVHDTLAGAMDVPEHNPEEVA